MLSIVNNTTNNENYKDKIMYKIYLTLEMVVIYNGHIKHLLYSVCTLLMTFPFFPYFSYHGSCYTLFPTYYTKGSFRSHNILKVNGPEHIFLRRLTKLLFTLYIAF